MSALTADAAAGAAPADPVATALEPLRSALLATADADAARIRTDAEADARRSVEAARAEADTMVAAARARGEADAAVVLRAEETAVRRAARAVVLTAEREAWDSLRHESVAAVRALLGDPDVRAGLDARLRGRLPGATVRDLEGRGLSARSADGRTVDASAEALVDLVLPTVGPERLWAP